MLQIDNTIVSLDLIDECFLCDLKACKGTCCVDGDDGAPLFENELPVIEELLPLLLNDLPTESQELIAKQGFYYIDGDGDAVTSIVNGAECVFVYTDEDGCSKCAIEKAFREGKTDFYKPISCHLYPVRLQSYTTYTAVNYHRWDVCECARKLGLQINLPVYKFLKEPLIRHFGTEWYDQLDCAANELKIKSEND